MILPMELPQILQSIGDFYPNQLQQIQDLCSTDSLKKQSFLLKEGQICSFITFLTSGTAYQSKNIDGEEVVLELYTPGDIILNHSSFMHQKPSTEEIKAFSDCKVSILSIENLHQLISYSQVFLQLAKVFESSPVQKAIFERNLTPYEKYQQLLDLKPNWIQSFPLKMIASYLKITPETLSRVRAMG